VDQARDVARRVTIAGGVSAVAFAALVGAGASVIPGWFTGDPSVRDQTAVIWPWFVGLLPFAGVVYALDGVLIGAGDVAYLRTTTVAGALLGFLPMIWLAYALDLGLGGIWAGLALFVLVRLVATVARWRSPRWTVVGATR
jgi:Na+-driven multidrug efflux pump